MATKENLANLSNFWRSKNVLITGHSGFKGSWLSVLLNCMGAKITGFALPPNSQPNAFDCMRINKITDSNFGDIRDPESLVAMIKKSQPDIIFHMAAQPLVRDSYSDPKSTMETNILGTVNLLEGVRCLSNKCAIINVTTDKVYENKEWTWGYREIDALGGSDPYSASKSCADILAQSYQSSFYAERELYLSSVRSGNVIGGGDWSRDRLVPDILRALRNFENVKLRYPNSTRPWQHVLEPLYGYVLLAQKLFIYGKEYAIPFNFGPSEFQNVTVSEVCSLMYEKSGTKFELIIDDKTHVKEAQLLQLDSSRARSKLRWQSRMNIDQTISSILDWHDAFEGKEDMQKFTEMQIKNYLR